jgi:HAD superfamily hydrolase (TIGR01509 family)
MTVKALIFDFDGLILETEYPIYKAIRDVYIKYGTDLKLEDYTYCVGSIEDNHHFLHLLEKELNIKLDINQLSEEINQAMMDDINSSEALPGVENILIQAKKLDLTCVVASSSDFPWVSNHLNTLGLTEYFSKICTRENVKRVKPEPDLFLYALTQANVQANEAIVFEDSQNGILAASRAGIFSVAVPNIVTRNLDFSKANLILNQIDELPLSELLTKVK